MVDQAAPAKAVYSETADPLFAAERAHIGHDDGPLFGLAISGGGIRSASFALGLLQALHGFGAFEKFHYLSTVSGGGYIGGALTYFRNAFTGFGADWFPFGYLRRRDDRVQVQPMGARIGAPDDDDGNARARKIVAYLRQHGADFISVMPTNLYGPGDNYHPEHSHVPAALIRRFHEAKVGGQPKVVVWGTGTPRREFMAVDDLADACVFLMKTYSGEQALNIGTGRDVSIGEFARLIADIVGYRGEIVFDTSRPDGAPQKLLDVSRLRRLGWQAKIPLRQGLEQAYADFLKGATVQSAR